MSGLPDTQNKAWAENKSTFGYKMLQRMGWSEGKGLGKTEDGMATHVKIKRRTEQLGIGAEVDTTGNIALTGAVQDYNALLATLAAHIKSTVAASDSDSDSDSDSSSSSDSSKAESSKAKKVSSGSKRKASTAAEQPTKVVSAKRRAYVRVLRNKDVGSYSKTDLAAILGHRSDAAPAKPVAAAPHETDSSDSEHEKPKKAKKSAEKSRKEDRSKRRRKSVSSSSSSESDD